MPKMIKDVEGSILVLSKYHCDDQTTGVALRAREIGSDIVYLFFQVPQAKKIIAEMQDIVNQIEGGEIKKYSREEIETVFNSVRFEWTTKLSDIDRKPGKVLRETFRRLEDKKNEGNDG